MVTGLGGVGLAALMAAKISGCKEIIAVDRVPARLEMAKELGATQLLNTSTDGFDFAKDASAAVNGQSITHVIETTAVLPVIAGAMSALGKRGRFIQLGVPHPTAQLSIPFNEFFHSGKTFECHYLGDTTGQEHIPKMIQWYRDGKFPIDKIVKYFPASEAIKGLEGMESGSAIKPVIVW
jgi:Zn-dependent alcohol dehydrogenase